MAVRSASAMFVPMLGFQAQNFQSGGVHAGKIDAEQALFQEITRRLEELKDSAMAQEQQQQGRQGGEQKEEDQWENREHSGDLYTAYNRHETDDLYFA